MERFLQCHDQELFKAIASGNEAAFRVLFDRYKSKIYTSAYKWTGSQPASEDITQEIFIRLWIGRGNLLSVEDPASYIFRALANRVKDYMRSSSNRAKILLTVREQHAAFSNITEETISANSSRQLVFEAMHRLTSQKRNIYCMNRDEGKSIKEIAHELQLSPHTVKSHLYEAIQIIRNHLKSAVMLLVFYNSHLF